MLIRTWRLAAILLTALSMGAALAHLLELPAKIALDGPTWVTLLNTLYPPAFGTVGATFEVLAVLSVTALAFLVRRRHPAFGWTLRDQWEYTHAVRAVLQVVALSAALTFSVIVETPRRVEISAR